MQKISDDVCIEDLVKDLAHLIDITFTGVKGVEKSKVYNIVAMIATQEAREKSAIMIWNSHRNVGEFQEVITKFPGLSKMNGEDCRKVIRKALQYLGEVTYKAKVDTYVESRPGTTVFTFGLTRRDLAAATI